MKKVVEVILEVESVDEDDLTLQHISDDLEAEVNMCWHNFTFKSIIFKDCSDNNSRNCCNCKYYEGVKNSPGHAPCSFWNSGGVMWDDFCSRFEHG